MFSIDDYPKIIDDIYKDNEQAKKVLLVHCYCVAKKALKIIEDKNLDIDKKFIFEGSMLHDVGIIGTHAPQIFCYGDKPYMWHGIIGASLLQGTEYSKYASICTNHFGVGLNKEEVIKLGIGTKAMEPQDINEMLIAYADNFYSKSKVNTLDVELTVPQIIKGLSKFGKEKVETFLKFHEMFS